ncbi:MAG: hypothetical protein C5B55_14550 [Blastocatellia bacterium]|nr:MAG: hypothetical protein C5B55_14550 [Blastocatellia bacterium]
MHEHDCDQLGKQFITALNSCPICLARLDVGPVFPSSVADYVKRIKAANKLTVTFDYESGVFTDVDDGEFLLIRKTLDGGGSIVLPRAARFESRKDFYELYQDYYHCNNFNAGDVQVIEPCRVEPLLDGWKLQSMGTLEVVNDQPRPKKQENAHIERNIVVQEQRRGYMPVEKQETPTRTCSDCGALVETRYAFCWKCGNPMTSHSRNATRAIETIGPSREIVFDYEDATVEHKVSRSQPLFSSLAPELREASRSGMLRMIGIGIVVAAFLLIPLGLLVLIRSASNSTPATVPQNATSQSRTEGVAPGTKEKANGTGDSIPQVSQLPRDEEDELRRLRAERLNIAASDRPRLIQSILGLEKRYPNDYRFPYERAKLAINQQDKMSHEEAFSALSLAAEKAIKSERAEEMLDGLETDKTTDFHKLSHGHREWTQIVDALKGNDVTLLARNSQF